MPLWTSYLVKIYAWKLLLAKEGISPGSSGSWPRAAAGRRGSRCPRRRAFAVVGYIGMFLVFVYMWLPFMILPMQAALERVPAS